MNVKLLTVVPETDERSEKEKNENLKGDEDLEQNIDLPSVSKVCTVVHQTVFRYYPAEIRIINKAINNLI